MLAGTECGGYSGLGVLGAGAHERGVILHLAGLADGIGAEQREGVPPSEAIPGLLDADGRLLVAGFEGHDRSSFLAMVMSIITRRGAHRRSDIPRKHIWILSRHI